MMMMRIPIVTTPPPRMAEGIPLLPVKRVTDLRGKMIVILVEMKLTRRRCPLLQMLPIRLPRA